jgi:predicted RNA methylase
MELVNQIASWALSAHVEPLPIEAVPGTTDLERRGLAALGGLAGALAGRRAERWPEPLRQWAFTVDPPRPLVEATQRELSGGIDILAAAYERLVSGRSRRRLGTFFTPPAVVEFMLDRAESHIPRPAVVIDPGAGVGAFSLAAKRRWPDARVLAVDVNVVTLGLLGARQSSDMELVLDDFLKWAAPTNGPRLWIGNPPYTRHQQLTTEIKDEAMEAAGGLLASRRAGLSAHFLAATLTARQPDDVICYLLPGSWADTAYGKPLRRSVLESAGGSVEMYGFGTDIDIFEGTRVAAMVLVVGADADGPQSLITAATKLTASGVDVGRPSNRARRGGGERFGAWLWPRRLPNGSARTRLGDLTRIRRGVATGANRFFFLNDEERDLLPSGATQRAVLRLRRIVGDVLSIPEHDRLGADGERRWLLAIRADGDLMDDDAVVQWLTDAMEAGVHERYLVGHRDPWYAVESVTPPDVLFGPMSKRHMRAVRNETGAIHSNAIYGLYLDGEKHLAEPLTAWLNSEDGQLALRAQARTYGAGLVKLEPSDLAAVLVPSAEELVELSSHQRPQ